jgi:hypothetical protein
MVPHNGAIEGLIRLSNKYSKDRKIGTLTIDTILRMTRLILDINCFANKDKYYKQVHGGAMGSAFTQVLANIYMLEWEQDLIKYQTSKKERTSCGKAIFLPKKLFKKNYIFGISIKF